MKIFTEAELLKEKFRFPSTKGKNKLKFFGTPDDVIDMDIVKGAHIELFSNKELILEGCRGVFEYDENYIRLRLANGSMVLCGSNFDIRLYEENTITIKGNISTIEFCV